MLRRFLAMCSVVLAIGGAMLFSVKDSDAGGCKPANASSCGWVPQNAWTLCDDSGATSHNHHHHHGRDVGKPIGRTACDRTRPSATANVSAARQRIAWRELPLRSGGGAVPVINEASASSSGGVVVGTGSSGGGSMGGMGGMGGG